MTEDQAKTKRRLFTRIIGSAVMVLSLAVSAHADDVWRLRPNEAYDPGTYCNWNRTGLPLAQQKVCAARDQKNGVYKPNWRKLEADNGTVYYIDLNSIIHSGAGGSEALVASEAIAVPGRTRLFFDCQGHFMDEGSFGDWAYAAPRSIAGEIAAIACGRPQ
jgi:hypothetical protein